MIEVENISYTYPGAGKFALTGFSASFATGEIVAVTGPNGCGKTTLSKLLVGLLRPYSGLIRIDGGDIRGLTLFQISQKLGYLWQNPNRQLFAATAAEEVAFGLKRQGLAAEQIGLATDRWLDFFHLAHKKQALPLKLSLGEKQRLALAAVLALGPPYLALDEPTVGLDRRCRRELGELLRRLAREQNCGIVIISHEADFVADYTDRQVMLA